MKVIFQKENFRIVEKSDEFYNLDDLKCDVFNIEVNKDICPLVLAEKKQFFEKKVSTMGVYGYILEQWNPSVGVGWEHIDSCHGFIGPFDETNKEQNHYIVEEFIDQIESFKV